jgi:N-methylhydantoinase B
VSSRTVYEPPGGPQEDIGKIDVLRPAPGSRVTFMTPGGGGVGDPFTRDPAAVLRDVEEELVSPDSARSAYGVIVRNGTVDDAETARARSAPRGPNLPFVFGAYREQFESEWPEEVQRAINRLLEDRPQALRQYLRVALLQAIRDRRRRDPTVADLDGLLTEILTTLPAWSAPRRSAGD